MKTLRKFTVTCTTLCLVGIFSMILLDCNKIFAQENGDAQAAKKKYEYELAKSWSFGWENYKNKQYERAIPHFHRLAKLDTVRKFPRVYRYLGDSYLKLNKPDTAQVIFENGLEQYPEDAYLHRLRGFLLAGRGQVDEAIVEYEKVVELKPESVNDMKQLALHYVKADRIEDAIARYENILQIDPEDVEAQKNISELLRSTGDIEGVIEAKEKIRAQDPENSRVRFDLGKLYLEQDEYEKAIELYNEFLGLVPGDMQAMELVGQSYQRLEKYRDAIAQYKKILAVDPQNKRIMCEISRCYREIGSFTRARSYAGKALAVDVAYGLGWIVMGEAYETSAERCDTGGRTVSYDDKLVYELAYQKYVRASWDLEFKGDADNKLNYLGSLIPTTEDVFMHSNKKSPASDCYQWIPKTEFGKSYWNTLNKRLGR